MTRWSYDSYTSNEEKKIDPVSESRIYCKRKE